MCNIVCNIKLDAKTAKEFKEKISDEYRVNMYDMPIIVLLFSASIITIVIGLFLTVVLPFMRRILDNLPLVVPLKRNDQDSTVYQLGFHVGLKGQYSGVCSLFK